MFDNNETKNTKENDKFAKLKVIAAGENRYNSQSLGRMRSTILSSARSRDLVNFITTDTAYKKR